jgi:hypothetical protein
MMQGAYQLASAAGELMPKGYASEAALGFAMQSIEAKLT